MARGSMLDRQSRSIDIRAVGFNLSRIALKSHP